MKLVETLSADSLKNPAEEKESESDFSSDFSNLNEDLQKRVKDYQSQGWTITKSPEGYHAEIFYGMKEEKTVLSDIQSIDALFAAIEAEEKEYQQLIADQEPAEEKIEKNEKENHFLSESSGDYLKRLQLINSGANTVTREVYVRLTDAELLAYVDEQNTNNAAAEQLAMELKIFKNQHKSRSEENAKNAARISHALKTKEEKREIECYEDFDYRKRIVRYIRKDNFEDAGSRPMTEQERQRYLPLI